MLLLVTYDVNTTTAEGRKRLRHVAKICVRHGQRVQNSVFECLLQPDELVLLKHQLLKIMDPEQDSIRFYNLGAKYQSKIDHYGAKHTYDPEEILML